MGLMTPPFRRDSPGQKCGATLSFQRSPTPRCPGGAQFDSPVAKQHDSMVLRSYRYRLMPTRAQSATLLSWLVLTRELYNACLQERRDAWQKQGVSVTAYDQQHALAAVRGVRPEFAAVPIVVQRGAVHRLDRAFAAFFRRCKSGDKPGYPRFRGQGRFDSILIDDLKGKTPIVAGGKRIKIPLLGKVKFKQHRPLEGTPKAMRLKLDGDGHWYVTFACVDVPAKPLPPTCREVGVDLGLTTFAALSDGTLIDNPRPLVTAQLKLARAQRKVARRKKGGTRRRKAVRLLRRQHFHVAQVRRQHAIDVANLLVRTHDHIYIEDLNTKGLARSMLARSVNDAGWATFTHWLCVKAEEAGREVVKVNPSGTSQTCPDCGQIAKKPLSQRIHRCACRLVLDRDVAAARVILAAGRAVRGAAPPVRGRQRSEKGESATGAQPYADSN